MARPADIVVVAGASSLSPSDSTFFSLVKTNKFRDSADSAVISSIIKMSNNEKSVSEQTTNHEDDEPDDW
jgi:hypothetical protein